jgi:hypothetical protein
MLQEGMIFHLQYEPESGLYNDIMNYELEGRFDAALFQQAADEMVVAIPSPRTSFRLDDFDIPSRSCNRSAPLR